MRSATTCDPRRSATPRLLKVIDLLAFSSRTMTITWPLEQLLVKWHQSKPQTGLRVGAEVFHKGRLLSIKLRSKDVIRHLHISHKAPYLPPRILHKHCFKFLLGRLKNPGEMKNKGYAKFGGPYIVPKYARFSNMPPQCGPVWRSTLQKSCSLYKTGAKTDIIGIPRTSLPTLEQVQHSNKA